MKLGLYYSARDWYHPDYLTANHARYLAFYHGQLLELLGKYGKVDVLWFDHIGGDHSQWDPDLVLRMARMLQPGILINNRLHISVQLGAVSEYRGDVDTPEQNVCTYQTERAWESCLCLAGHSATVYGTRGGPFHPGEWGVSTHQGNPVYLHILQWADDAIRLPPVKQRILSATALTGEQASLAQTGDGITVAVAEHERDAYDTIVALELDTAVWSGTLHGDK